MARVTVSVLIDAPPAAVWAAVEDIGSHVDWMLDARSIRFTSERTRGVGTAFDCVTGFGPLRLTDRMTVTEWHPGRAMGVEHEGIVRGTGRFTLRRARGGRTRFTWQERLSLPWWLGGPLGALVLQPALTAIWRRSLRKLQAIVERD